jgi:hypothetical protein
MSFLLALALQAESDWGPTEAALRYLARHQNEDGSWGRAPRDCRCGMRPEAAPTPDAATAREISRRIGELGSDEFAAREAAVRALVAIGPAASHELVEAEKSDDAEVRARAAEALRGIARLGQAPEVGPTAWALYLFVNVGYSHLSKDVEEEIDYGVLVRRAADWLAARQNADGAFSLVNEEADLAGALAMGELYGLTGSERWKEPADRGARRGLRDLAGGPRILALKALLRRSAELSDLGGKLPSLSARFLESARQRTDSWDVIARAFALTFDGRVAEARVEGLLGMDPAKASPLELAFASLAVSHRPGHREALETWAAKVVQPLFLRQQPGPAACDRGSWCAPELGSRVESTALLALACRPCSCRACRIPFFMKK